MRNIKVGLFILFYLYFSFVLWGGEYGITSTELTEIENLEIEQLRLINILYTLEKAQREALKRIELIEIERLKDRTENEKSSASLKKIIEEREKDIIVLKKRIENKEKEIQTLKNASILSEEQLKEAKKLQKKSGIGIIETIVIVIAALGIGYAVGTQN